jgi:hypothetical protein
MLERASCSRACDCVEQNGSGRMTRSADACGDPGLPLSVALATHGEGVRIPDEWLYQKEGLVDENVQPAVWAIPCRTKAQLLEPSAVSIDQCVNAELLGESLQLTSRRRPFGEVYEMDRNPSLREKPLSLARGGTLLCSEDLDGHRSPADVTRAEARYASRYVAEDSCGRASRLPWDCTRGRTLENPNQCRSSSNA